MRAQETEPTNPRQRDAVGRYLEMKSEEPLEACTHPADVACALAGYDLHEGICQQLAGTAVLAGLLAANLRSTNNPAAEKAEQVASLISEACEQTRKLASTLHVVTAAGVGLYRALKGLASLASKQVACRLEYPVKVELPAAVWVHLYRIAHETVANALAHAHASELLISCCADEKTLTLSIEDNGLGFAANSFSVKSRALREISRWAELIQARLTVESSVNWGTRISCTVPIETT